MSDNVQRITQAYDGLENTIQTLDNLDWESVSGITYRQGALQALRDVLEYKGTVPDNVLGMWLEDAQDMLRIYSGNEDN